MGTAPMPCSTTSYRPAWRVECAWSAADTPHQPGTQPTKRRANQSTKQAQVHKAPLWIQLATWAQALCLPWAGDVMSSTVIVDLPLPGMRGVEPEPPPASSTSTKPNTAQWIVNRPPYGYRLGSAAQHVPMVARTVRSSRSHGCVARPSRPTDVDVPMSQGLHQQHTRSCHNASSREHHVNPPVLGPHESGAHCAASLLQSWEPSKQKGEGEG